MSIFTSITSGIIRISLIAQYTYNIKTCKREKVISQPFILIKHPFLFENFGNVIQSLVLIFLSNVSHKQIEHISAFIKII